MKKRRILTFGIIGILYIPFYFLGTIIHFIARFLLAISNVLLLDFKMAKDIFKSLAGW